MKSVADELRRVSAHNDAPMSVSERVTLAFELGDQDLGIFRQTLGIGKEEALRELRRRRQIGRRPCGFFETEP